jgi:hypothetical protein
MARGFGVTTTRLLGALVIAVVGCGSSGGAGATGGSGGKVGTGGAAGGSGVNGGSGTGGGFAGSGGGGPISFSQYETLVLAAGCQNSVLCGDFPDVATCLSSQQVLPHYYDTLGADVADGKIGFDPAQAQACVDEWNSLPCTRTASLKHPDDPCDSVFTGTVAVGGTCYFDQECAAGSNCQIDYTNCSLSQCCPGTCAAIPAPVGAGSDCTLATVMCATGTTCTADANGLTATCQRTPAVGDPCTGAAVPCQYPLYCDPTSGTCKAPVDTGGACNPQLNGLGCDEEADVCESATSVCTRMPAAGSPCDPIDGGTCLPDATCDTATGICAALPGVGQSCSDNLPCLEGIICDQTSSTCLLTPAAGACS